MGTVTAQVLAANANRIYALITNDSDTAVYLRFGTAAAVANEGIRLGTGAGERSHEMSRDKGNVWSGAIQGISSAASKKVIAVEGESLNPT